ncbi:MAG: phytanoyl-CoA dioxygenase family protein [Bryobacterales bacterium]|nr:phytanoyl-CoA dioxygenase family protein [Bryobacterales bacterium]
MKLEGDWRRDGIVVARELFSAAELAEIESQVGKLLSGESGLPVHELVYEPGSNPPRLRNAFRLHQYSSFFYDLARRPALTGVMRELLGSPLRLYSSQMFLKPGLVGTEVPWHQDMPYWPFAPAEMATAWIALDDTTIENGCVRFLKGSHTLGELPHEPSGVTGNSLRLAASAVPAACAEEAIQVTKGSVVIHHCLTVHRSDPNSSPHDRRGLLFIYMSPEVRLTDASRLKGVTDFPVVDS